MTDPGPTGRFGEFGGRFVPETLVPACLEIEAAFAEAWADPTKAREQLGWIATRGLEQMCADAWRWQELNPNGYQTVSR